VSGSAHNEEVVATVETPLHRAPAECKVLATILFVVAVALVPRGELVWPYAVNLTLLAAVVLAARTPLTVLLSRLVIELPFVLFVLVLPFAAASFSEGAWLAFGILAKATLAVLATGVLAWTTPAPEILHGAERLRVPRTLIAIAGFALRYLQVLLDELRRMRLARVQRGDDPRWLWQARGTGRTVGALVVRTFERGERVHAAMLARGYDGTMPALSLSPAASPLAWAGAMAFAALPWAVTVWWRL
jgi:cobalt/nickel transport system permease protein